LRVTMQASRHTEPQAAHERAVATSNGQIEGERSLPGLRCPRRRPAPARSRAATRHAARRSPRRCCSAPSARARPTAARRARWETRPACPRHALRVARAGVRFCPLTRTCTISPSLSLPPPDCRVEGRAQARVRRAGAGGRDGGAAAARCAGGCRARRGHARAGGADGRAGPTGDKVGRAASRARLAGCGGARA